MSVNLKIDLCIGGTMGLYVLDMISVRDPIGRIITQDRSCQVKAEMKGFHVVLYGNLNELPDDLANIAVLVHYPVLLKQDTINRYRRVYNFHPGYLPWGRGYYPVVWSIIENTPIGATIHRITDEGIDNGPIVKQLAVNKHANDTAKTLYNKIIDAEKSLFLSFWKDLLLGRHLLEIQQDLIHGTYHNKAEFEKARHVNLDETRMPASKLMTLARAFTFPPYDGLEVIAEGHKYTVALREITS